MTYKLLKNSAGEVIAYGPNDDMYEPSLKKGDVLVIEEDEIAQPLIAELNAKLLARSLAESASKEAAKASAIAKLEALGLTEDEAKAIFG